MKLAKCCLIDTVNSKDANCVPWTAFSANQNAGLTPEVYPNTHQLPGTAVLTRIINEIACVVEGVFEHVCQLFTDWSKSSTGAWPTSAWAARGGNCSRLARQLEGNYKTTRRQLEDN